MARKPAPRIVPYTERRAQRASERRAATRAVRAQSRTWLDRVTEDLAQAEQEPLLRRAWVDSRGGSKLGSARRWLSAQVGRPWSKVYAELCERFDARSFIGHALVRGDLLGAVRARGESAPHPSRFDLEVDPSGILRRAPHTGQSRARARADLADLARGRVCALTGRGAWWFRVEGDPCAARECPRSHTTVGPCRYHDARLVPDGPLRPEERQRLDRLPDAERRRVLIPSPWAATSTAPQHE